MKKFKLIVLTMVLVASMIPCSVSAASSPINVTINGVAVQWTDATPYVDANNRTMVPLRAIGEAMGLDVEWDKTNKSASFSIAYDEKDAVSWGDVIDTDNDSKVDSFMASSAVLFTLDDKTAVSAILFYRLGADLTTVEPTYTETGVITMDTAAVMKDNRTYAPVKYLAEFYGYTVNWDQKTKTVILTSSAI